MKKIICWFKGHKRGDTKYLGRKYYNSYAQGYDDGYNEAIDDVIDQLTMEEES